MLLRPSAALLIAAASLTQGFKHTSPFFLLSTEPLKAHTLESAQIATAAHVEERLVDALSESNAQLYLFVSAPGLSAADFQHMPHLKTRASNEIYKSKVEIPEIVGGLDALALADRLGKSRGMTVDSISQLCAGAADFRECRFATLDGDGKLESARYPLVVTESGPQDAAGRGRVDAFKSKDQAWDSQLSTLANLSVPHVIVLMSGVAADYDMDESEPPFQSHLHTDLKRDVHAHVARAAKNSSNAQAGLPLFETYQFLSPGIFMSLTVSLLLFVILYVGVSAIAGLEVSYLAFSKEMGPAAQNKGKQQ